MQELREAGFPVTTDATTIDEAANEIMRVLGA
jgi:energy-coupling factor transport system ATP-binding protein